MADRTALAGLLVGLAVAVVITVFLGLVVPWVMARGRAWLRLAGRRCRAVRARVGTVINRLALSAAAGALAARLHTAAPSGHHKHRKAQGGIIR